MSAVRPSATNPDPGSGPNPALDAVAIQGQLAKILADELFQHSRRYPSLLKYVVEQVLAGAVDDLKERTLGIAVFRRHPEYDTSADPVVRTTASEIRKRLEAYYSQPAHAEELRIVLPVGSYVPEFRLPPAQEPAISVPQAVPVRRRFDWRIGAAAAALLVASVVGAVLKFGATENALHRFWSPVFNTPQPVLMVFETLMAVPRRSIAQPAAAVEEVMDPNLFLIVNEGNSRIAAYLGANGKSLDYALARNVTVAQLRARPFILKGAFNNPLTRQAVASLRYSLRLDRIALIRSIVDREDPSRHWDSAMSDPAPQSDYALIVRAPEPQTGQTMIVIAGLGERGGAAATEFLTNPRYMERFAAQAPQGWERRNLEIVLETALTHGDWGEPRMVANYIW